MRRNLPGERHSWPLTGSSHDPRGQSKGRARHWECSDGHRPRPFAHPSTRRWAAPAIPSRRSRPPSTSSSPSTTRWRRCARASSASTPISARASRSAARITIADNGSTDGTWELADRARRGARPGVGPSASTRRAAAARSTPSGRRATRACSPTWTSTSRPTCRRSCRSSRRCSPATATSRSAPGSRAAPGSCAGPKRELISRSYNRSSTSSCGARFSDAQCGFKAIRADRARELLPLVHDRAWFFDTELLVLAERAGLRIHEVPVDWVDDPDSRVDIVSTALADLRGVARLVRDFRPGRPPRATAAGPEPASAARSLRFASIGVALDARLRGALPRCSGSSSARQAANALALLLTAIANTAANRRFTFAIRGPRARRPPPAPGARRLRRSRSG